MDRYSKIYKSKWQSQYSDAFKRKVCQEYLEGEQNLRALERKYKLGNSRISGWLRSFGLGIKRTVYVPSPIMPKKDQDILPDDSESVRLLKKQLEDALLEKELYRRMIEVAERDLKINIRKKSASK